MGAFRLALVAAAAAATPTGPVVGVGGDTGGMEGGVSGGVRGLTAFLEQKKGTAAQKCGEGGSAWLGPEQRSGTAGAGHGSCSVPGPDR